MEAASEAQYLRGELGRAKARIAQLTDALKAGGLEVPAAPSSSAASSTTSPADDAGVLSADSSDAEMLLKADLARAKDEQNMLQGDLAEVRKELAEAISTADTRQIELEEANAERNKHRDLAKRLAKEIYRLREEAKRKDELARQAISQIKQQQQLLQLPAAVSAKHAEAQKKANAMSATVEDAEGEREGEQHTGEPEPEPEPELELQRSAEEGVPPQQRVRSI